MRRHNSLILALLLSLPALSWPALSWSGPLDDGLAAFNRGDYQQAFNLWKPLAEAGDAKARYNLGLLFQKGLGVEKNLQQARLLFEAAAKQGDADAQYQIGYIFYQGLGVFRSNKEALYWWRKAAAQNHPRAQYNLGIFNAYGIGIQMDHARARELWRASAEQGEREAIKVMIRIHQSGEFGAEVSAEQAAYWKGKLAN